MYEQILMATAAIDEIQGDPLDELISTISSLYSGGMTRRGISELLDIHEKQVRDLLDAAFSAPVH